jgi:uncharacterized protein
VPAHDDPVIGANVITTLGAVHRITTERLAQDARRFADLFGVLPRPLVAVLLGGDNRAYRMTEDRFTAFADHLAALASQGFGLAITPSRRTDPALTNLLRRRLAESRIYLWDGGGDNPYFGLLGAADAVIVTADSVSMVSEAAATGKPVYVADFGGGSAKFDRFHEAMSAAGVTRPFRGTIENWSYDPPADTARAAAEIRRRLAARLSEAA